MPRFINIDEEDIVLLENENRVPAKSFEATLIASYPGRIPLTIAGDVS